MIELREISKRFGGVQALRDVSLTLQAGQVHCLAGENGSGKSTLIKVLAGVVRPDRGTIRVDGRRIEQLTPIVSVRMGIQIIYQDLSLFPNLTVAENLALNSELERGYRLVQRRRTRRTAERAIERLGVQLPLDDQLGHLPVAQKQLVAIARALVQNATLIIFDEPTTALTEREVEQLFGIIDDLKNQGVALLMVSHKLREMERIGDSLTILRNGRVVAGGPASEFSSARISRCMTGRTIEDRRCASPEPRHATVVLRATGLGNDVLQGVDLSLEAGRIVGLTGLLGSGQTELALALFGLRPCRSGSIAVEGQLRAIHSVQDAMRAGVAYVPEDRLTEGLFLDQSVANNLIASDLDSAGTASDRSNGRGMRGRSRAARLWAALRAVVSRCFLSPRRIHQHAATWIGELEIRTDDVSMLVSSLSGGNQQRIVLAKWLSRQPRIVILNGPTVGVDVGSKQQIHEKLRQLAEGGLAVLMISDDLSELASSCDRVVVMHRGRIVGELAGDYLTEDAISDVLGSLELATK